MNDEKIINLITNFKEYIDSGGDWEYIQGVNPDMSLSRGTTKVSSFNLYKYIKDNFGLDLNAITVESYMANAVNKTVDQEEEPTGFLSLGLQYSLLCLEDGTSIVFEEEGKSLGRSSKKCDVIISGNGVSRVHCLIKLENGVPSIRDNGSTNGTFINHKRLNDRVYHELQEGDHVMIADKEYEVRGI